MDYRSELEKKIEAFFELHSETLAEKWQFPAGDGVRVDSGRAFIKEGKLSPFRAVYELFDGERYEENRWCFRSEGKRIAVENISTGNTIDGIIRSVMNGIIGAINDNKEYQKRICQIINEPTLGEKNGVKSWYVLSEERQQQIHSSARNRINCGESYLQAYMTALDEGIGDDTCYLKRKMLQNIEEEDFFKYRSYSKYLAAPLFKYYKSSALTFSRLKLNSLKIEFQIQCFDWCGEGSTSWDEEGNEYSRCHEEVFEYEIDMKYLCSKKLLMNKALELLQEEMGSRFAYMDIDYVDFSVIGFTIDLEHLDKTKVNNYIKANKKDDEKCIASQKSYKKDKEVISTDIGDMYYTIRSEEVIQIIRFLYILFIWGLEEERHKVTTAFFSKEFGIFEKTEIAAVEWFLGYMEANVKKEREEYGNVFDFESKEWDLGLISEYSSGDRESILRLLEKFRRKERFPNAVLFEKMKRICLGE